MKRRSLVSEFDDSLIVGNLLQWSNLDSKAKGTISEGYVKNKLCELGFSVLVPFMGNDKYDLAVDCCGSVVRIQVKCATYDTKTKRFRANLQTRDRNGKHIKYKKDDVDVFVVFCPIVFCFYVIPVDIGIVNHSVGLFPHRGNFQKCANSWESYRDRFDFIGGR